jgi:uncharacterized protein (TIGR04562 family)
MSEKLSSQQNLLETYVGSLRLSRDVLDVMLRGKSAIDTRGGALPTKSVDAASRFIAAYGFNLEDPIQAAEVLGVYHEAIRFIQKYFLRPGNPEGLELNVPPSFFELDDIRKLFVFSTERQIEFSTRTHWACSIIRVMHTIVHLDKDFREDYFPTIQKQVFDRFYKEIHNIGERIFLGDPKSANHIELKYFQTKPRKERESKILKLLHKAENVAEDIYDQVGVRFVTNSRMDCLRVLKFMRDHNLVVPANIKPSRSRNSLVDPFLYRRAWREARSAVQKGDLSSVTEVDSFIEARLLEEQSKKLVSKDGKIAREPRNLFTADSYTAIQFTSRQLIKYRNPVYEDVKKVKLMLRDSESAELRKYGERLDISSLAKEQLFFYPYEVQIMDAKAYEDSQSGSASHVTYKAAQVQVAAMRVLGHLTTS